MFKKTLFVIAVLALLILPNALPVQARYACSEYDGDWCAIGVGQQFPSDCYSATNSGGFLHGVYHIDYQATINGIVHSISRPAN